MKKIISIHLPDTLFIKLEVLSKTLKKSKSTLAKKTIGNYLNEYADYQIISDRLHDESNKIITPKEFIININNENK
jgi:predicted DNA-binding protein